jgi:hypothetical protein
MFHDDIRLSQRRRADRGRTTGTEERKRGRLDAVRGYGSGGRPVLALACSCSSQIW